jgi:protein kinase A
MENKCLLFKRCSSAVKFMAKIRPWMIAKKDIMCVEKTGHGPFWEEFLVFIEMDQRRIRFANLRVMKKKKIIDYNEEDMIQYEYHVRTRLRHPFLINFVSGFQDYEHLFLLTEQSQNYLIRLLETEGQFSLKISRFYLAEVLLAVQYLHAKGCCYGFLSPWNIMVGDDGHIKLKYEFLNGIDVAVGGVEQNIEYASIDYLRDRRLTCVSDYWGMGVLLYQMLLGNTPFQASTMEEKVARMHSCSPAFPDSFDRDARDLITRLLRIEPSERLGYRPEDMGLIQKHPFFESMDWAKLVAKELEPPFLFNITRDLKDIKAANLRALYTTDYLPHQKDGYGQTFGYYGSITAPNPYTSNKFEHFTG